MVRSDELKFKKTKIQKKAINILTSDASNIMLFGGARSGKTSILLYSIIIRACKVPSRHCVIRKTLNSVISSIWLDSLPKILSLAFPNLKVECNNSKYFMTFPNGSEIWMYGLDSGKTDKERADKILGMEFATILFNECSIITYQAVQIATSRLSQKTILKNKAYFDCNPGPKSHWSYKLFVDHIDPMSGELKNKDMYRSLLMNPADNAENLSDDYIDNILGSLSHRQRQRLELGIWLDDIDGALWSSSTIEENRLTPSPSDPIKFDKTVVGVDPAISKSTTSDETGIIVCGRKGDTAYVLGDYSGKYSPSEWAKATVKAYKDFDADLIIAEKNQGGDMVRHTLQSEMKHLPIKLVSAYKGKSARAEPIVAHYENGFVKHLGAYPDLEDQMCSWVPNISESPDRVDALVYACTHLLLNNSGRPKIIAL